MTVTAPCQKTALKLPLLLIALSSLRGTLSSQIIKSGENYSIYYPFRQWKSLGHSRSLIAPPKVWIQNFETEMGYLHELVELESHSDRPLSATDLYLQTLRNYLVGDYLGSFDRSVTPRFQYTERLPISVVAPEARQQGLDWPLFAMTMTGRIRLDTIKMILEEVIVNHIPGDIVETGVWRGGLSIFMRGVLLAHHQSDRVSYLCDSFAGLPESKMNADERMKWDHAPYLEISDDRVKNHFILAGITDPEVVFVKGFFTYTMKPLSLMVQQLSILRLDGDMYESTVDVLYHLYDKLSVGGYAYIDDYSPHFPAREACDDFIQVHNFSPTVIVPDYFSGYWKKTEQITIQYWRYIQKKFKA
jgi:O-methyltransferase